MRGWKKIANNWTKAILGHQYTSQGQAYKTLGINVHTHTHTHDTIPVAVCMSKTLYFTGHYILIYMAPAVASLWVPAAKIVFLCRLMSLLSMKSIIILERLEVELALCRIKSSQLRLFGHIISLDTTTIHCGKFGLTARKIWIETYWPAGAFLCRVCMFSMCLCGFPLRGLVYSYSLKTCRSG